MIFKSFANFYNRINLKEKKLNKSIEHRKNNTNKNKDNLESYKVKLLS